MFERFRRDLERLFALDGPGPQASVSDKLRVLFHAPQIQAIAIYRFGSWVHTRVKSRAAKVPLQVVYHSLDKALHALWGVHIDHGADIGGGLYIGHTGDVLIGPVTMGVDCNLSNNTLIGRRTDGRGLGLPTFGDRVWIGPGSVIFGNIVVGSGVSIAPLTVVGRNVPPRTLVLGNPMQVMKRDYDNTMQIYGKATPETSEEEDSKAARR